jgi:uncharacterized protein (TIGR03435 family)
MLPVKVIAGCVLLSAAPRALGQQPAGPPAFEVASIKPSDPAGSLAIRRSGLHLSTTNSSLLFLITWAYDIQSDRVLNQPKWLDSARYDIVANAAPLKSPRRPGQPTELQQMMQSLLAERFKLVLHRETKDLPVYALIVAKGGPKVHLSPAPETMGQNPFQMPGSGRLTGAEVSAEMLANVLSGQLRRTVQDQTSLQGVFDFKLQWDPEPMMHHLEPAELRTSGSLFTALQEQLGLKLEARKAPVEVLVIDRMESTPTEN